MTNYLITVVGATAIGKTALSIILAKHFNTEIISCDSRQFYKEMHIGTAVPSSEELQAAKHHFIQNRSITEDYSVGDFEKDALAKLETLFKRYKCVIMVGGSGLYANAVIDGLDYFPEVDSSIRMHLNNELEKGNLAELQQQLKELDEESYTTIEIQNPHRLVRALEICIGTGKPYSSFKNKAKQLRNFKTIKVGLTAERELMYNRINQRVDIMMQEGLLQEVENLLPYKHLNALQTVGYRELFSYLEGAHSLEVAIEEIKKNTRRFAKRQVTWNKKDTAIHWFNFDESSTTIITTLENIIQID